MVQNMSPLICKKAVLLITALIFSPFSQAFSQAHAAGGLPWYLPQPATRGVRVAHNVSYVDCPTSKHQKLDVYVPKNCSSKPRAVPVVVWIHGGAWKRGSKRTGPFQCLLDEGIAVVSIDYRLSSEAAFPAQIQDCKAAIRWVRAHAARYGLDPQKIGVWGYSAGGHLAALLGSSNNRPELEGSLGNTALSSEVQAVVDWCGPTCLLDENQQVAKHKVVRKFLGDKPDLVSRARLASPMFQTADRPPPFLVMHGGKDNVVPFSQSEKLVEQLRLRGATARLLKVNSGHGFWGFGMKEQQIAVQFLSSILNEPTSSTM